MKIFIAGSMSFAGEIIETRKVLEELGFQADFAPDTLLCLQYFDAVHRLHQLALDQVLPSLVPFASSITGPVRSR